MQKQKIKEFLVIIAFSQSLMVFLLAGMTYTKNQVGEYIYEQTAAPFLTQSLQNHKLQQSNNTFAGVSNKIAKQH